MSDAAGATLQPNAAIPADDPNRKLTVADPDSSKVRHVAVVGGTYSILVSGAQTAGRYCLIDMIVPDGSGPPLHRHDFEELFTLLEGEIEFTFRGETTTMRAGWSVNIPANAPHVFKNTSGSTVHMLCMCTPAGQEEFFVEVGDPLDSHTSPLPKLDKAGMEERMKRAKALAPKYHTELLKPRTLPDESRRIFQTREVKKDRIVVITRVDGGVGAHFGEQLLRQRRSGPKSFS